MIGLAWLEQGRLNRKSAGAETLEVATMIAIGIGLHNFAEGLAIGQSFAGGAVSFGTTLVIGFALHNATEGFGIAGPLVGTKVSWGRILWLGVIGGGPTVLGAVVGGVWVSPSVELLFLSLALGSLIYVTRELFRIRFQTVSAVSAMTAVALGLLIGFGTELIAEVAQSRATTEATTANAVTVRFAKKQAAPASLSLARGQSLTIENGDNVPMVFEGNGLYVGEVVVPANGKITVAVNGKEGQYSLVDERGQSAAANITVQPGQAVEPLTDEVAAVGALTVLEGHVRASKELHDRGASKLGPDPALDLKRAGKHAGHPQHELLMGNEPDALNLQKLLRARNVFDSVNNALTAYVKISGDGSVAKEELEQKYQAVLTTTEQARRAIAGVAYDTPSFRARAARFVMDTAASEYATATEGGRVAVIEPGVPGKDNFIEYQDARDFLAAAYELLRVPPAVELTADGRAAFDRLRNEIFATLDPAEPNHPVPASEVKALIERAERGLGS
ncbi:MAG TPA: ZIP family metal transporter [Pyrinomonadaceae bacterium]|nr:ZIP family metal transporter [Pyrinomonadaceae bacterium]